MEGDGGVVYAKALEACGVVGEVLALVVEVKLMHREAVVGEGEEADVLLLLEVTSELVGVDVVAHEHRVALEGVEEVACRLDDRVGGVTLDALQLPHPVEGAIDEVAVARGGCEQEQEEGYGVGEAFHMGLYFFIIA